MDQVTSEECQSAFPNGQLNDSYVESVSGLGYMTIRYIYMTATVFQSTNAPFCLLYIIKVQQLLIGIEIQRLIGI